MAKIIKRAYTISEACQYLGGISRPTLYKLMGDGGLPLYRIGRRAYVALALERWAKEYNRKTEKENNWDEWLQAHPDLPGVKGFLARNEVEDAKA